MINQFDYFFSELRQFVLKPEMEPPMLFVGLAYTTEFLDNVLFGAGISNAICKIVEFAYLTMKIKERLFQIKEIDNFFSYNKLSDAEYLTNLILDLNDTQ